MKVHLAYVPFTGLGLFGGFRGNRWLKNRIKIFNQFVLPSLLNQKAENIVLWISFRPEEKLNDLVRDFVEGLERIRGLHIAVTYGGICFWDDKYDNDKLLERLTATLPELKKQINKVDEVYMTLQPSDDMYVYTAFQTVRDVFENKDVDATGFTKGYIMNMATKEVAEYNPTTLPPFFTIRFPADVFFDPQKHYDFTGPYKSHEFVASHMKFLPLEERGFVVGTHGENISTVFNHPYKGRTLNQEETEVALLKIGAYFTDPVVIHKGVHLAARHILNVLPFQNRLRSMYHSLPESLKII